MFRILEIIFSIILLVGLIYYFKKIKGKSNKFTAYLSVVLVISSMCSGILVESMPVVYENLIEPLHFAIYVVTIILLLAVALSIHRKIGNEKTVKLTCGIWALVGSLMFFMNMEFTERSGYNTTCLFVDFFKSFSTHGANSILPCLLFPLLYKMYIKISKIYKQKYYSVKGTLCIMIPAGFFAGFMVLGSAFDIDDTLNAIFDNELQIAKALFLLIGFWALFFFVITWMFHFLDELDLCKKVEKKHCRPIQWYISSLQKRPFITAFVTLWIVYIPYIIASYPGIYMADCPHIFRLVFEKYPLDNAHPIMYTLLFKICLKIGINLFNSINVGTFIYSLLQITFVILVVSLAIKIISDRASYKIIMLLLGYYAFYPRINSYMMLMTKDIICAVFMLAFIVAVYILSTKKRSLLIYVILGVSDLGAVLFRHDQVYIIAISMILIAFLIKDFRKQAVVIAIGTLTFFMVWNNVLLVKLEIPSTKPWGNPNVGSILSSIMVQQTARCVRASGEQFTDEEKEVISAVFDFDALAKDYDPRKMADNAVNTIKSETTSADWKDYEKIWFKMFFKYPKIYIESILNFKYQLFYPFEFDDYISTYWYSSWNVDKIISELGMVEDGGWIPYEITYPESLDEFRIKYEAFREGFFLMPIINIIFKSSTFIWCLFIWFAYCIYHKDKRSIAVMMPLLVMVLVLIAGPTNGYYFRYQYPYALCLPIVIVLGLIEKSFNNE